MDRVLSLTNVDFQYGPENPLVLNQLGLKIPAGKVTAILGPNGTGKTTMLHLMLGLLKPDQGKIEVSGKPHGE